MPRVKDIAWKFVIRLEGEKWRCPYCEIEYSGKVTRVKSHFLQIPNRGISVCTRVPEHIRELMQWLLSQVCSEDDIAWKFVHKLEDNKWHCYHCNEVLFGDLTRVKCHLLRVPNGGIPICLAVPNHVITLMKSLLGEAAEEESTGTAEEQSREVRGQSSVASLSRDMPTEAEVEEEESREATCQFATEPQRRDMPTQAEVAEEESREATYSHDISCPTNVLHASIGPNEYSKPSTTGILPRSNQSCLNELNTGISISCPTMALAEAEPQWHLPDLSDQPQCSVPSQMQINDRQTPTRTSSFQYDQLPDVGNSNCSPNCHQHSQLQIPMDIDPSIASQEASVFPRRQSVPQPSMNHERRNAPQNPTLPSSSCNKHSVTSLPAALLEMDQHMLPSTQAPDNAPPFPQIPTYGTSLMFPYSSLDTSTGASMTSHPDTAKNFEKIGVLKRKLKRLFSMQADIMKELEYAANLSLKKPRKEVANWLADVDKLSNEFLCTESVSKDHLPSDEADVVMQEAEELMKESNFRHGLFEARVTKFSKFLEEKMVGEAFQKDSRQILEYLIRNQVSRLGIYGMGGVGKTTIMRYIHNRLLEEANYGNVIWVTVSQDFNPQKLQDDIWKALDLGTLEEKDLGKRAAMLSGCLKTRGKSTIILDDVWEDFDLEKVGIPIRLDGFKLVLTTRSFDVCCMMQCQERIKIEPLSQEEAESLFFEELGSKVAVNSNIEAIVKSIVAECNGLPLGVITMARSMRGSTDMFEWEDLLRKLKKSDMVGTEMERKVLMNLKVSYDRLDNHEVQQCFLSCALYPEEFPILDFELIEFFIDQGFFDKLSSRNTQHCRGFTVLNKLKNASLLEHEGEKILMHDLIRDMALHIMSTTSIVKGGQELIRIPSEEDWTEALEKVSLMGSRIVQFSSNESPNYPKLSVFLLNQSLLDDVPCSFFERLQQLKVLNLSGCNLRELPSTISFLVNLRALLLIWCSQLRHVPHLGKLRSLRKLDVTDCRKLKALNGLRMLVNLRYLNLLRTKIEILPKRTLGNLKNLQWLLVNSVHVGDFAKVWPLERFQSKFKGVNDFNKFVRITWQNSNPRSYFLQMLPDLFYVALCDEARVEHCRKTVEINKMRHAIVSVKGESTEERSLILGKSTDDYILIPHDVQELKCGKDNCITDLSGMYPLENLESLHISKWEKLRVLCGGPDKDAIRSHESRAPTTAPLLFPSFPSLGELNISKCQNLKYLFGHGSKFDLPHLQSIEIWDCPEMLGITVPVAPPPPHSSLAFPSLTVITVKGCGKMKRVVEPEWLPHFPKLSFIIVSYCDEMEELIGVPPPYSQVEEMSFECLTAQDGIKMRRLLQDQLRVEDPSIQNVKFFRLQVEQGQEGSVQSSISLPKLRYLRLYHMARLKSICAPIFYDPMNVLEVSKCPGLSFATTGVDL